jgi:hypothetical protein
MGGNEEVGAVHKGFFKLAGQTCNVVDACCTGLCLCSNQLCLCNTPADMRGAFSELPSHHVPACRQIHNTPYMAKPSVLQNRQGKKYINSSSLISIKTAVNALWPATS